jgi:hypothetical protein
MRTLQRACLREIPQTDGFGLKFLDRPSAGVAVLGRRPPEGAALAEYRDGLGVGVPSDDGLLSTCGAFSELHAREYMGDRRHRQAEAAATRIQSFPSNPVNALRTNYPRPLKAAAKAVPALWRRRYAQGEDAKQRRMAISRAFASALAKRARFPRRPD